MAAALARASFAGQRRRETQPRGDDGPRVSRVAPEASAWAGEEADPWVLSDGRDENPLCKTLQFVDFAVDHQFTARLLHSSVLVAR